MPAPADVSDSVTVHIFRILPRLVAVVASGIACVGGVAAGQGTSPTYDLILRGGTIVDGTGAPRYRGDVAIARGHIARVGDLTRARARTEIDVRGLFVAPGFINIHSHAQPSVLPTAENMLTQGVTTEILNADGAGPADIGAQLDGLAKGGLAVNVGASAGFNSAWSSVMGPSDHRPTPDEIARIRGIVLANLERGAFGVSAGLDYKPAYFAKVDEVIRALDGVKPWRTFFPNHDRLTPESGFSSRKGMDETVAIGVGAGIVPVFTHMKVQGHEQGTADDVLAMMRKVSAEGTWVAADVYPYLAGQTALAALIIPGWAQDGGIARMRERFADSTMRARIIVEADAAITARLNGPSSIVLNETGRKLSDIMVQQGAKSAGEAVVKVLETEFPSAIMSFGLEDDLIKILKYPSAAIACDCGAWTEKRAHPRGFGTFPRILGHYVRELHALSWEEAVRKMSALPASITGLVDRGFIAPGMAADIAVFDTATVIDHATYEHPDLKSDGIRVVLVNGVVALRDGSVTGERGGRALRRSAHMPSRPMQVDGARSARTTLAIKEARTAGVEPLLVDVAQGATSRFASGRMRYASRALRVDATSLGIMQVAAGWASLTGWGRVGTGTNDERPFTLMLERADPMATGDPSVAILLVDGEAPISIPLGGRLSLSAVAAPTRR